MRNVTFLILILNFLYLLNESAGITLIVINLLCFFLLALCYAISFDGYDGYGEGEVRFASKATLYLSLAFACSNVLIYESKMLLSNPIVGASGFNLGEHFQENLGTEKLICLDRKDNRYRYADNTVPKLTVSVYVDHNDVIYKIENEFSLRVDADSQGKRLVDVINAKLKKHYGVGNLSVLYYGGIYDGNNIIELVRHSSNPNVIYYNEKLEKAYLSYIDEEYLVAPLNSKLEVMIGYE